MGAPVASPPDPKGELDPWGKPIRLCAHPDCAVGLNDWEGALCLYCEWQERGLTEPTIEEVMGAFQREEREEQRNKGGNSGADLTPRGAENVAR